MLDLLKVKEDFSSLVLDTQPWTLAQFVMWLDLKLSEYKIKGYMVLDHNKKTKPRWITDTDTDHDSDTAPLPPPCRKPCCWTERAYPDAHYDNRKEKCHDFLTDYQDTVPDHNKCIVDLSEQSDSGRNKNIKSKVSEFNQGENTKNMTQNYDLTNSDLVEISENEFQVNLSSNDFSPKKGSANRQSPQNSLHSKSQSLSVPHFSTSNDKNSSPSVRKVPSSERKQSVPSATITHPSQAHPVSTSSPHEPYGSPMFTSQAEVKNRVASHDSPLRHLSPQIPPQLASQQTSMPVPVALHAASSDGRSHMVMQPDGSNDLHNVSESDLQIVADIKQEMDIGGIHYVTDMDSQEGNAMMMYTADGSHLSSDDDLNRGSGVDQGWSSRQGTDTSSWLPGQNRPMVVRPISEQAQNVELPKFEDPLVRRVLEDSAPPTRHMWSKIITRCAYHMLSKGVPHKHDYQIFSEAFYHRYPCIGTNRGPNPWTYFAATISQKVRNDRRSPYLKRFRKSSSDRQDVKPQTNLKNRKNSNKTDESQYSTDDTKYSTDDTKYSTDETNIAEANLNLD